jgi:hypothetical protein
LNLIVWNKFVNIPKWDLNYPQYFLLEYIFGTIEQTFGGLKQENVDGNEKGRPKPALS